MTITATQLEETLVQKLPAGVTVRVAPIMGDDSSYEVRVGLRFTATMPVTDSLLDSNFDVIGFLAEHFRESIGQALSQKLVEFSSERLTNVV